MSNAVKNAYERLLAELPLTPKTWLITGVAGFIGSNLLETLLKLDQHVVGLDNFATGYQSNLDEVQTLVSQEQWNKFKFINGDIRKIKDCLIACAGIDYVLHQAALGSVPRSIADPQTSNDVNIGGFLNMLLASRDMQVKSFVYAASSSTYGDHPGLPKREDVIGKPLSPYAVTKYVNELYADVFYKNYQFGSIGLRYFNVFGSRQSPNGAYAAVIPKWIKAIIGKDTITINGDGETSRDFCYVKNVIQANILAAIHLERGSCTEIVNVAVGQSTTLNLLHKLIADALLKIGIQRSVFVTKGDFRLGDVRHSMASIEKCQSLIGYKPEYDISRGLDECIAWYAKNS